MYLQVWYSQLRLFWYLIVPGVSASILDSNAGSTNGDAAIALTKKEIKNTPKPLTDLGASLFDAIETNDIQWIKTNEEKLSECLGEKCQYQHECLVSPLEFTAINGNIEAFKIIRKKTIVFFHDIYLVRFVL